MADVTRSPSPQELSVLQTALDRNRRFYQTNPEQATRLLSNGESGLNNQLDQKTHAAWTIVALSILNLNETITMQ